MAASAQAARRRRRIMTLVRPRQVEDVRPNRRYPGHPKRGDNVARWLAFAGCSRTDGRHRKVGISTADARPHF